MRDLARVHTSKLGRRRAQEGHETRSVNNAAASVEPLALVRGVVTHCEDRVLAAPPDAFDVDIHGQIPYPLLRVEGVVVLRVHDP